MAQAHQKHHDYHIIDPSPWPFTGSVGALVMAIGGVGYMKYIQGTDFPLLGMNLATPWIFFIGLAIVLYTMFGWWSDTIKEGQEGHHTPVVSLHLRYGMIMF
ncbi:MAG: cytochrome c oxidase subunit 3, partial [Pararhizobium sp.]